MALIRPSTYKKGLISPSAAVLHRKGLSRQTLLILPSFSTSRPYPPDSILYADYTGGVLAERVSNCLNFALLGAQYELQADVSTTNIGVKPACDDLAFAGLPGVRGMRTCGAVTNLNSTNDVTLWYSLNLSPSINGVLTINNVNNQHMVLNPASLFAVGIAYTASIKLREGTQRFIQITYTSATHGTSQYANIDIVNGVCTYSRGCSVYVRAVGDIVEIQYTATSTTSGSGSVVILFAQNGTSPRVPYYQGDGVSSVEFISLMLSATAYPVPCVPPGVTQTSTAHNGTSGIHYAMPQNGPVWNQLSLAKPLTLAALIVPGVGSADLPSAEWNNGVLSASNSPHCVAFAKDSGGNTRFETNDGSVPIALYATWSRYEQLILATQVNTAGTQFRAGVYRVAAKTWSWSSWAAFDGSFNPSAVHQKLMIAFGNNYPMWHLVHWMSSKQSTESEILTALKLS